MKTKLRDQAYEEVPKTAMRDTLARIRFIELAFDYLNRQGETYIKKVMDDMPFIMSLEFPKK